VRRRFGYMPEERGLYPKMPVRSQLVYFARLHGMDRARAEEAADSRLAEVGLSDRAEARVLELSHGNQQRVQLAAAVIHEPELIVLDEPFSGLDPIASAAMSALLTRRAEQGAAVLFSSHQLDVVEDLCRDVVIVDHGTVVLQGEVSALRAASPRRYVELAGPGAKGDWVAGVPGARVVEEESERLRVALDRPADPARILDLAASGGAITRFVYEPPPLSEVFRRAVGR
jgi:ABC-2 type transport system ATP-binding protein